MELHQWLYHTILNNKGNTINVGFQLIISKKVNKTFGPYPDTNADYNFKNEVKWLPFKFNNRDAPLNKNQQDWFIYDHIEVFSLQDKDL